MKKLIRLGLVLGVLTAALTCTALAAGTSIEGYTTANENCTVTYDAETGKYTAAYTGATEGNQYALLVVKGTEDDHPISEDTIMYIDQKAADADGVEFTFIPRSTPDCVVLLGGVFEGNVESPVTLGTLIGQGVTVSGTVKIGVTVTSNITLTLYHPDGTPAGSSSMNSDGSYSIPSVPEGTYYIKASKPGFIGGLVEVTVTGDGDISAVTVPLYGGDLNSSGGINAVDLTDLLKDFGATDDMENPYSDINESGGVNAVDLAELLNNFGKNDETVPLT